MNKNEIRQAFDESYYRINKKLWWLDLALFMAAPSIGFLLGVYFCRG